ncbi:MAG TPA: SRPBCC family protein [Gammaproteobacteria bacterium]|nr:SRPBCC family protein [Gammaproteobacteria bacterium]
MRWSAAILLVTFVTGAAGAELHSIEVTNEGARYRLSTDVSIAAPPAQVYRVLTDYNHLTRISGAIRASKLLEQIDTHTALVYVETRACVAFFCRTLKQTQQVVELTPRDIVAQTLPDQSNVSMGTASWHLEPEGEGTRLRWQDTLEPTFWIPPLIGPAMMKDALREQIRASAQGIEKLAREWAHLPPLTTADKKDDKTGVQH